MQTEVERHRLLTLKEAATFTGLHPDTLWRKVRRGEVPAIQLGGRGTSIRIDERELERWLYSRPGEAA